MTRQFVKQAQLALSPERYEKYCALSMCSLYLLVTLIFLS